MIKLIARKVEEIIVPPLPEYSYVCDGEIREAQCKGSMIFRDPDFILITPLDALQSFSLNSIISYKLRGRKLKRWEGYLKKYNIELEGTDTRVLLKNNALLTIYVDGLTVCEVDGEVVIKEYRIVGTDKNVDEGLNALKELKPDLITVSQRDIWYLLTAYKVVYITPELKRELSKFVGVKRIECDRIEYEETTICYVS